MKNWNPLDLFPDLRSSGWTEEPEACQRDGSTRDPARRSCTTQRVIVPLDRELEDSRILMLETQRTLAAGGATFRPSELDVLAGVQAAQADVIQWRWIHGDASDGIVPLDHVHRLLSEITWLLCKSMVEPVESDPPFARVTLRLSEAFTALWQGGRDAGLSVIPSFRPLLEWP